MFFSDLGTLTKEITESFGKRMDLKERTPLEYRQMRYPKWFPLMKFETHQYDATEFGNLTTFETKGLVGRMQLATIICTPSIGSNLPLLLLDAMVMPRKEKAVCFVEFYDCTKEGVEQDSLFRELAERYNDYPDYKEEDAWYVKERAPYSLVKSDLSWQQGYGLQKMMRDTMEVYAQAAKVAKKQKENVRSLKEFQKRMLLEGNPSSKLLEKLLGKEGAVIFFNDVIMPVPDQSPAGR